MRKNPEGGIEALSPFSVFSLPDVMAVLLVTVAIPGEDRVTLGDSLVAWRATEVFGVIGVVRCGGAGPGDSFVKAAAADFGVIGAVGCGGTEPLGKFRLDWSFIRFRFDSLRIKLPSGGS